MTPTAQVLFEEYGKWIESAKYRNDGDVLPLQKAAARHLKTMGRSLPLSELAPCLAVLYFAMVEFEGPAWKRWIAMSTCWVYRLWFRGRPMWNDFYMGLWQLSRDPRYIGRLHSLLKRGSVMQLNTGAWMVNSVCQQDAEFAEHWGDVVRERGEVFGGAIAL